MAKSTHGRKHFHNGLQGQAKGIIGRIFREQLTHAEYLALRNDVYESTIWIKSTARAKIQFNEFLRGAEEMLHASRAIVWKHRTKRGKWVEGRSLDSASFRKINPEESRHVWASSNKVWFEPEARQD